MNYEFHLEEWLPLFPLRESYGAGGHYSGDDITSPCDICNVEWLRRGLIDEYDWGEPVPVDIFVMSKGEPENRYATKIGGLPYRPASARWPCDPSGRPLAFMAQFNFTNSVDIVGELPGDLLLVFGDDRDWYFETLRLEWRDLGLQGLIQSSQVPSESITVAPCFGNRCRMMSYPNAVRKTTSEDPQCYGKDVWESYLIPQLQATQIGRAPFFIQEGANELPGRPLCTIASVQPDPHQPYPWVNVPEPLCPEDEWPPDGNELMIGDLGCIYIFIEDDGTLHAGESCY
jgi:hypothetical protein